MPRFVTAKKEKDGAAPAPASQADETWRQRAHALMLGATEHLGVQFMRYIVVGGLATVADFGVLVVLTSGLGVHYLISNAAGFVAGLTVNYVLSVLWVFASRKLKSRIAEFTIFAVVGVVGLGLSQLVMYLGVGVAGVYYPLVPGSDCPGIRA